MSQKRPLIAELVERRSRNLARIPRLEQTRRRLQTLDGSFHSLHGNGTVPRRAKHELLRYFPIALVAITEGHFKMLYRDLIDSGDPFLTNATGFKDIRIDISTLLATSSRTISVGEFIASQLPHNNLAQIEAHLSMLLDQNFSAEFTKRLQREDAIDGQTLFQTHLRQMVIDTFRERHVYCHELASRVLPRAYTVSTYIKVFRVFVELVEEHVAEFSNARNAQSL